MTSGKPNTVLVATLIALCIVTTAFWLKTRNTAPLAVEQTTPTLSGAEHVRDILPTDHILGNPTAPLVFIIYSDFACPYCKEYHATMRQVIKTYGKDGQVALVYRHMPIAKLHPESATYALASECVAQQAGNTAFWNFSEMLYATVTPEHTIDSRALTALAVSAGASGADFSLCMRTSNLMANVEKDFDEALDAGATETPFTVMITPYQHVVLGGAQPFPVMGGVVTTVLRNLGDLAKTKNATVKMPNLFDDTGVGVPLTATGTTSTTTDTIE
ncbi:MAG: thioredoxin domain-containing protein [Candidatus Pacebacteria bacterium]|nr:thioredoxin domain-containing protein [Candidatus Paceibacterota bacterium]